MLPGSHTGLLGGDQFLGTTVLEEGGTETEGKVANVHRGALGGCSCGHNLSGPQGQVLTDV